MNVPIDISDVVLKTERLTLRPWMQADLEDFYEYARVDGVGQMAGWLPHRDREESQRILTMFIEGRKTFALEYQGKVVGSLGVETYNEEKYPDFAALRCRELGFVLAKPYWGMGLMPEAVREVIRYLFEQERLDALFCCHFDRNRQSARVQAKCGFRFYRKGVYQTRYGTVEDDTINVLTREQWLTDRA